MKILSIPLLAARGDADDEASYAFDIARLVDIASRDEYGDPNHRDIHTNKKLSHRSLASGLKKAVGNYAGLSVEQRNEFKIPSWLKTKRRKYSGTLHWRSAHETTKPACPRWACIFCPNIRRTGSNSAAPAKYYLSIIKAKAFTDIWSKIPSSLLAAAPPGALLAAHAWRAGMKYAMRFAMGVEFVHLSTATKPLLIWSAKPRRHKDGNCKVRV